MLRSVTLSRRIFTSPSLSSCSQLSTVQQSLFSTASTPSSRKKSHLNSETLRSKAPRAEKTTKKEKVIHPWSMSSDEFWRIKNNKIYPHPVQRVPFEQRTPGPKYTMKILESEQVEGIKSKYPNREVDDFQVGDRVAVTMYVSLHKEKMEVSKGLVIHRTNTGPNGYFTIRNMKLGVAYEYSIPYWSPFVHKIENLGTTIETKKKSIKWIRKMDPKLYTVK